MSSSNDPQGPVPDRQALGPWVFSAASAAVGYVVFYELNACLFKGLAVTDNVSWIFLPAAVRMLAVLLAGWAGVAGLFVGSLVTMGPAAQDDIRHALTLATLSSVPSWFAAAGVQRMLSIPRDLRGLTGRSLLYFGLAGGLANSLSHTVYFMGRADSLQPLAGFVPMFVGDTVGTVIMLYAGALIVRRLGPVFR